MNELLQHIKQYHTLPAEAEKALTDNFEELSVKKNDFLIREGMVCRYLYFLKTGCLRGYYNNPDGKEVTHWFAFENDFVTSFHSFITSKAAVENIHAIEDAVMWRISGDKLKELFNRYPEIERLMRIAYEKYYIRLEERYVNAQFKTARELYENLLQTSPQILQRMPLGFIASYLGISQETLSRIRGKR